MHLTNPRALAGGIEETKPTGVLTPDHSFWVKTHLCCPVHFPRLKRGGYSICIASTNEPLVEKNLNPSKTPVPDAGPASQ